MAAKKRPKGLRWIRGVHGDDLVGFLIARRLVDKRNRALQVYLQIDLAVSENGYVLAHPHVYEVGAESVHFYSRAFNTLDDAKLWAARAMTALLAGTMPHRLMAIATHGNLVERAMPSAVPR